MAIHFSILLPRRARRPGENRGTSERERDRSPYLATRTDPPRGTFMTALSTSFYASTVIALEHAAKRGRRRMSRSPTFASAPFRRGEHRGKQPVPDAAATPCASFPAFYRPSLLSQTLRRLLGPRLTRS